MSRFSNRRVIAGVVRSMIEGVSLSMLLLAPVLPVLMWVLLSEKESTSEVLILTPGPLEQKANPVEFACARGEPCKMRRFKPSRPGGSAEVTEDG